MLVSGSDARSSCLPAYVFLLPGAMLTPLRATSFFLQALCSRTSVTDSNPHSCEGPPSRRQPNGCCCTGDIATRRALVSLAYRRSDFSTVLSDG